MLEGVWEVLPIVFLPVDGTVTRPSQREEELPFSCYFFLRVSAYLVAITSL